MTFEAIAGKATGPKVGVGTGVLVGVGCGVGVGVGVGFGIGLSVRTFRRIRFSVTPLDHSIRCDSEMPSGVTTSTASRSPSDSFKGLSLTLRNTFVLNLPLEPTVNNIFNLERKLGNARCQKPRQMTIVYLYCDLW